MTKRPINKMTTAERNVIAKLEAIRDRLKMSDAEFHRRYITKHSYSVFHRIRNDKYTGSTSRKVEDYARDLARLEKMLESHVDAGPPPAKEFLVTDTWRSVEVALTKAMKTRGDRRLVVVTMETGQGKSALSSYLTEKFNATYFRGSGLWKNSYTAPLRDLASSLGLAGPWATRQALAHDVWSECSKKDRRLIIGDEANSLSPEGCNMIRDTVNATNSVILLLMIGKFMERLKRKSFWEAAQMIRRCQAVIETEPVKAADVEWFMRNVNFNGCGKEAFRIIAEQANKFGHFDMVERIRETLESSKKTKVDLHTLNRAVQREQAMLQLGSGVKGKK